MVFSTISARVDSLLKCNVSRKNLASNNLFNKTKWVLGSTISTLLIFALIYRKFQAVFENKTRPGYTSFDLKITYQKILILVLLINFSVHSGVALQLYWNHTSAWVFSFKFASYFQNTFFYQNTSGELLLLLELKKSSLIEINQLWLRNIISVPS